MVDVIEVLLAKEIHGIQPLGTGLLVLSRRFEMQNQVVVRDAVSGPRAKIREPRIPVRRIPARKMDVANDAAAMVVEINVVPAAPEVRVEAVKVEAAKDGAVSVVVVNAAAQIAAVPSGLSLGLPIRVAMKSCRTKIAWSAKKPKT